MTGNVLPLHTHGDARLVDEMALALLDAGEVGSDYACWQALRLAGFGSRDIGIHLDTARDLARLVESARVLP